MNIYNAAIAITVIGMFMVTGPLLLAMSGVNVGDPKYVMGMGALLVVIGLRTIKKIDLFT